jgi:uncharacterized membrane protein YcaP (DUF421 family)
MTALAVLDGALFASWSGLARTLVVGVIAYAGLVTMLRVSGKRTLSKMNAFDLVVTVALGSTLASILTSKDVVLAEGVLALALLIALQWLVAWSASRSEVVSRVVKSEPRLLAHRGELLQRALRRERVAREEVLAALRAHGLDDLGDVSAVVLETDGSFSVLRRSDRPPETLPRLGAPPGPTRD